MSAQGSKDSWIDYMRILILFAFLATIHLAAAEATDSFGRAIENFPEALRLIRNADEVYTFCRSR
jgi:hypothetical protein